VAWVWLLLAIGLEVAGTTSMKLSLGFTRWIPSVAVFLFYGLSFGAFILALKAIPLSIAYAIWAGVGTASIVVIGVVAFHEGITWAKAAFVLMIIAGVVGLRVLQRE
jgi:small multidrug resistance pump